MNWRRRNRIASYLRSSLWIIPFAAVLLEQISVAIVLPLDTRFGWAGLGWGLDGAKAVTSTVVTFALSFVVFTFGSLLVAVQVASGQYTPRVIATTLLCDNVIRYTVGLFVFTMLFAIKAQNHIETTVPQLLVFITGVLGFSCLVAFLFLIDYAARLLRPVTLVQRVGEEGLAVIETVYPDAYAEEKEAGLPLPRAEPVERTTLNGNTSAILLAVDVSRLVTEAENTKGIIELAPQVGAFLGGNEPLFLLHSGAAAIHDEKLRECVIFGSERTMEQDPLFAFRILVDIAIKALSAAINDPTTAVLAIDQLHRLLRSVGRRNLRTDFITGPTGVPRVILRTPNWSDFVHLAFTEIRFCGVSNVQIARRLRAMLVNLGNTLPEGRRALLHQEEQLLDRMIEAHYQFPEDLALARVPDPQGLGGSTGPRRAN